MYAKYVYIHDGLYTIVYISWFFKKGYPEQIIDYEMEKVNFCKSKKKSGIKKKKGVPFVVTYHPKLKNLSKIIKDNLYLLYMNDEVKKTFTPSPMISFRSSRKINNFTVTAELYPVERTVRSYKCGKKRCEVWEVISETDTFSSTVTGKNFKINHKFNCTDKCLVYLATCKICNKQYTGQTTDSFRPAIPDKIYGTKWINPVELGMKRKVWYLFLRVF